MQKYDKYVTKDNSLIFSNFSVIDAINEFEKKTDKIKFFLQQDLDTKSDKLEVINAFYSEKEHLVSYLLEFAGSEKGKKYILENKEFWENSINLLKSKDKFNLDLLENKLKLIEKDLRMIQKQKALKVYINSSLY